MTKVEQDKVSFDKLADDPNTTLFELIVAYGLAVKNTFWREKQYSSASSRPSFERRFT